MNTVKKAFAVLLVLAIAMSLSVAAFAAEPEPSITINNPSTDVSIAGKTVTAYKIFNLTMGTAGSGASGTTAYRYEPVTEYTFKYTPAAAFGDDIDAKYAEVTPAELYDYLLAVKDKPAALQAYAAALSKWTSLNTLPSDSVEVGTDAETATIDLLDAEANSLGLGYYLVTVSAAGTTANNVTIPLSVSLDSAKPTATVSVKVDAPKVDKKATTSATGTYTDDAVNVQVGDTVYFSLHTKVPNHTGYEKYVFEIADTMTAGLLFNHDVEIWVKGEKNSATDGAHALTSSDFYTYGDSRLFRILFEEVPELPPFGDPAPVDFLPFLNAHNAAHETAEDLAIGDDIYVYYSAIVTEEALKSDKEVNSSYINYSNDPTQTDGGDPVKSPSDSINLYDFSINLNKVDGTDSNSIKKLAGAVFALKDFATGDFYQYNEVLGLADDSVKWVKDDNPDAEKDGDPTFFITNKDGDLVLAERSGSAGSYTYAPADGAGKDTFKGLKAGKYSLVEIKAPEGYNPLSAPITVEIKETLSADRKSVDKVTYTFTDTAASNKATYNDQVITAVSGTLNGGKQVVNNLASEQHPFVVVNKTGVVLPSTGGIGTTIFYTVGAVMMVSALVLLITKKKMSVN